MSNEYSFNFAVDPATKLENLNTARNAKLDQWKPAVLESMPDADSPQIAGVTGGIGGGIDPTTKKKYSLAGQLTEDRATGFDAYEVAHPNDPYQDSLSGITKYERQRQRLAEDIKKDPSLAGKLGIKDVNNITNDDIARAGTREQMLGLYNLIPGPKTAWEPGPMDYYDSKHPLELGSKANPLNIQVERNFSGKYDNFGRPLADIRNKDTDVSVSESLGYTGNEDAGFSPLEAAMKLKRENKLTPEVAEYLAGKADRMNAIPSVDESFAEANRGSIADRVANTAKAVGSGVVGAGYDLADMGAELFGKDLGSDEEKTKAVNKLTGYNPYYTTKAGQDVKAEITKMTKEGVTADGVYNILSTGISNPEFLGESIGFLLPMMVGGVATAGGKGVAAATKGLNAAKKTGDVAKIEEATIALAKAKDEYTALGAAADFVSKNAGLLGVSAGETSDTLDKYAESAGIDKGDIDASKVAGAYLATVVKNGIDRWTDLGILKDPNMTAGLVNVIKGASEKQIGEIGLALGKVAGAVALGGGKEAGTEYLQTFIEQVNEQVGEQAGKTMADAWNNSENEIDRLTGAALGFTGAQQMNVASVPLAVGTVTSDKIQEYVDNKSDYEVPGAEEPTTPTYKDMPTEDLVASLSSKVKGFDEKASRNELISKEEFEEARSIKAELASRKAADVVRNAVKVNSLGNISDVEKGIADYFTEKGITYADDMDMNEIVGDMITKHVDKEELADIQIALKNVADVKDKTTWNKTIDDAIEARLSLDNLTDSAAASRLGVMVEGIAPREDRLGYTEYAKDALNGNKKSFDNMTRFIGVQSDKIDTLEAQHTELVDRVNAQIDDILDMTKGSNLTRQDVVKAMAYAKAGDSDKVLISNAEKARLAPEIDKVAKAIESTGANFWKTISVEGELETKYSEEHYSRSGNAGKFKSRYFDVIPEIASELGIKDINWNEGKEVSNVAKVVGYIKEEVADMDRLHRYIGETKFGVKPKESTSTVEPESGTNITPEDIESTTVTPEEDTTAVEVDETTTAAPEESIPTTEGMFGGFDTGKTYTREEIEPFVRDMIANKVEDSDAKRKFYRSNKEVIDSIVKDVHKEKAAPKKTGDYVQDEILNVDLEALTDDAEGLAKLREIATKKIGTKDDEVRKQVDAKQKEAKELLAKRIDAIVTDGSISLSEALHTLDLMESIRETAKAEIKELEGKDAVVTDAANRIEDINKEIYEAMKAKDEYKALSKNYGELVNRYEKELTGKTTEFSNLVTEGKKSIGDIAIDISDENIQTKLGKLVKELIAELKIVQADIVDKIKKGIANIRRVTTILNKTKDSKLTVDKKISELEAKIADLKAERKSLYSKPVESLIAERKELRREIAGTRNETNIAKDVARGVQYTKAMLVTSKKGTVGSKAAAKGLKPVPMDISKIAMVVGGKASSTLAMAKLDEKIDAVDSMIAKLKNNGIVPSSIGDTDLARFPYLMLLLDENGEVNYNVAAAMTTAVSGYITENKISLTQLTPRDMESFFGVDENDTAGQDEVRHLGIPVKYIANNIAKDIGKLLGIKAKSPEMAEAYEKVMLGLAQAAIYSEMGTSLREELAEYGNVGKVITVKLNDTAELGTIKDTAMALDDKFKVDLEKKTFRTEPRDISIEDVKILRNDFTKPSEEQAKAIVKYTNLGWYPIKEVVDVLDGLDDVVLGKLLGKKETTGDLTKSKQESIRGKNLQIESDIEHMRDMITAVKEGKLDNGAAYFDWGIWKVGRNAIDSSGFNPQSIKLHRYMGTYKAQRGTVKHGDISETVFKLGVAQALKFKIDKEPIEESMAYADKILTAKGLDRLERAIKAGKTKFVIGQETFKFEELSHAVMALTEGKKYVEANGKPFKSSMILESDGLTNGFAFKMLQYLVTKDDSFDLDQHLIEWLDKAGVSIGKDKVEAVVDRIKSGDIVDAYRTLGMNVPAKDGGEYMSITDTAIKGIDETVATVVNKAIRQDEDKMPMVLGQKAVLEKYGALTDLGKFNYAVNDTALNMVKSNVKLFLATQDALTDIANKITDAARELMKSPFMTFGYGAGFKSIINSVTANIEESMLDMLVKSEVSAEDKAKYDAMWEFAESIGFKKKDKELLKTKFAHEIKIGEDSNLHEEIKNFVTLTYGKRIEEVLTEEFKALTTVNKEIIQASTAMFHIWKTLYDKVAGVKDGKVPSKEAHKKALAETMSVFPVVASPLGVDVLKDGIPLVTQTRETGVENSFGNASVKLDKDRFGKGSSVVQSIRETYKEIGVGAVVNMNQMIDGGTMTKVMNKFDIAQVFDALLLGVEQADAVSYINEVFGQFALDGKWSHIGAVSDRLNDILFGKELQDLLKKVGMDKDELLRTVWEKMREEETSKVSKIPTIEKIAENLTSRNYQNKKLRNELNKNDVVFEQYVLDGEHIYTHKGEEDAKVADDIISKIVTDLSGKYPGMSKELQSIVNDTKGC